jgi:RNA polymerase sigma-70 factor (ECF subfamily)
MDATKSRNVAEVTVRSNANRTETSEVTFLVERAKAGDADAFGDLMHLYERRIIALGMQMGLSKDDSLDACQDAFIKVFRYIHRFRSGELFFKWLYRISLNAIYDHLRRNRQCGLVSLEDLDQKQALRIEEGGTTFTQRIEDADLAGKLLAELPCLTRRERIVLVLRDLQEMPTDEIGRILGVSQITVRRHCMSARQKLRDRLFPRQD